jgi:hypothetical protein
MSKKKPEAATTSPELFHGDATSDHLHEIIRLLKVTLAQQTDCCESQNHKLLVIIGHLETIEEKLEALLPGTAESARLILTLEGDPSMPATIHVNGQGAQATFLEFDGPNGTGNQVPAIGPVMFASDNQSVATVDSSGKVTAVSAGTANISGTDQGNSLTASDVLTVTAATAQSATLSLTAL